MPWGTHTAIDLYEYKKRFLICCRHNLFPALNMMKVSRRERNWSTWTIFVFLFHGAQNSEVSPGLSQANRDKLLLNGMVLRVPAFQLPPVFSIIPGPNGTVKYTGVSYEFIKWTGQAFNTRFQFVNANSTSIVLKGIRTTLINHLTNAEIDIIPYPLPLNWEESYRLDYTIPVTVDYFFLLQKWPEEQSRLMALVRPFSYQVWLLLLLVTNVAVNVAMSAIMGIHDQMKGKLMGYKAISHYFDRHFQYLLTVITNQGNNVPDATESPVSIVIGSWLLMMIVMINAYTGNLTSCLVTPKLLPIVNSLEEVATRNDMKLAALRATPLVDSFLNASSGPNKVLGDMIRKDPTLLVNNFNEAIARVMDRKKCVFVGYGTLVYIAIGIDYVNKNRTCRMTLSKAISYTENYSFGLPKGSPYRRAMDRTVQQLWENGLAKLWLKQYTPKHDQCIIDSMNIKPEKQLQIKLIYLSSAFLLLAAGIGISTFVFLLELLLHHHHPKKMMTRALCSLSPP